MTKKNNEIKEDQTLETEPKDSSQIQVKNIPVDLSNCVMSVIGIRGSGKTTFAEYLSQKFNRVLIFDSRWQIGTHPKSFYYNHPAYEAYSDQEVNQNLDSVAHDLSKPAFKIVYRPLVAPEEFPILCAALQEIEDCLFIADEISLCTTRYQLPRQWYNLIHFSRHNRIGVVTTTQRPTDVSRDTTAESNHIICFRQHEPRDITFLTSIIGKDADKIPNLSDHTYLWWHNNAISTGNVLVSPSLT